MLKIDIRSYNICMTWRSITGKHFCSKRWFSLTRQKQYPHFPILAECWPASCCSHPYFSSICPIQIECPSELALVLPIECSTKKFTFIPVMFMALYEIHNVNTNNFYSTHRNFQLASSLFTLYNMAEPPPLWHHKSCWDSTVPIQVSFSVS